jgi:cytochrome P450
MRPILQEDVMTAAPHLDVDPFSPRVRGLTEIDHTRAALRAAGPVVRVNAPAGGTAWIITDDAVARAALVDPRIVKDPAFAPEGWDGATAGLEPTAAEHLSLTTTDGPAHARLRAAHAPLFAARRMTAHHPTIVATARELLTGLAGAPQPVDLVAEFTTRYPLTVVCDLLGVPRERVDEGAEACRTMMTSYPADFDAVLGAFARLAGAALAAGRPGLAAELRDRFPDGTDEAELHYLLFGLIFAGQLTTDAALGSLLARELVGELDPAGEPDVAVRETLRAHPPVTVTLWRFTTCELELAGAVLPARAPVLVDIAGIGTAAGRSGPQDLVFGAGHHYCLGAQLAQLELRAALEVLRSDFPAARLAVPPGELRRLDGGVTGNRIVALPVSLTG